MIHLAFHQIAHNSDKQQLTKHRALMNLNLDKKGIRKLTTYTFNKTKYFAEAYLESKWASTMEPFCENS